MYDVLAIGDRVEPEHERIGLATSMASGKSDLSRVRDRSVNAGG